MKTNLKQLRPEISGFIESLQSVLQAEDKCLSTFSLIYGEEIPKDGGKTGGESMMEGSGLSSLFEDLKSTLKEWIGQSVELDIIGLLDDRSEGKTPGDKQGNTQK